MAEKLSQEQIDELLRSMNSGDSDGGEEANDESSAASQNEKKYKSHDFLDPKVFSKDNIRTFSLIYDNYAKQLSTYLSGMLRTECEIEVQSIEEQKYYEYNNALPESIMMGVINAKPIEGSMLFEVQKTIAYTIIDRLLGGSGDDIHVQENFSDIDLKLMERFYWKVIPFLTEAWSSVVDVHPSFDRIELNSRLTQLMQIEEVVIIVLFKIVIKNQTGNMSICMPCINLKNILANASSYLSIKRKRNEKEQEINRRNVMNSIKKSYIDVSGILGKITITLGDLMNMQIGDVIKLDSTVGSPAKVRVGNKEWFSGEIGINRNRYAIKITDVLNE